ncbi:MULTISPECIES: MerR family transcriptional regulator [unclassified Streptomyces]|uniref:MerR family transcriptional regulator n=1 Tax=unclassified Streptomyces TaxID=2593676 RepID=UPI002E17219D|nr:MULTISPECIES: MerR family transcriptional regulator [unclassified Streptomyces]
MTITEFAAALGVRTPTLRFWEREGLVTPECVTSQRARRHAPSAVGAARSVAALQGSGYGSPVVRDIITSLHESGGPQEARRILRQRLDGIGARSVELLRAGADPAAVVTAVGSRSSR